MEATNFPGLAPKPEGAEQKESSQWSKRMRPEAQPHHGKKRMSIDEGASGMSGKRRFSRDVGAGARRVSHGYHEVGQQIQLRMVLKELAKEQDEEPSSLKEVDQEDPERGEPEQPRKTDAKKKKEKKKPAKKGDQKASTLKLVMFDFVESKVFTGFILSVILMNTGILMAQTYEEVQVRAGWYFSLIDNIFLGVYLIECISKMYVYRKQYFKEGWNLLDFIIVIFNLVDFLFPMIVQNIEGFNVMTIFKILRIFRAFRAIRALRVLRTIRFLSNLQVIMTTCLQSIQSMGAIGMLIVLVLYMFAVIGRGLYFKLDPTRFGILPAAALTLFQLLTLDDWFEVYRDIITVDPDAWHIIIYLLCYIIMEYFIFLNLFVAVLVDNFQLTLEASNEEKKRQLDKVAVIEDDDEDDFLGINTADKDNVSDVTKSSEQSAKLPRKTISQCYMYLEEEPSDQEHLRHYYQCLAALEYNKELLSSQQKTIDNIVDLCMETTDDVVT